MMKRRSWLAFLLCVILCLSLPISAAAEGEALELKAEEIDAEDEAKSDEEADPEDDGDSDDGAKKEVALDTGTSANDVEPDGEILDNIFLESLDLSGMNAEEAEAAAEKRMEEIVGYQIILHMDDEVVGVTAKELGLQGANDSVVLQALKIGQSGNIIKRYKIKKDLEEEPIQFSLQYQVDEDTLRSAIEEYCVPLNRKVENYGLTHENGVFSVTNGHRGVELLEDESVAAVKQYLENVWRDGIGNVELAVELTQPAGSQEELARVQDVLGQASTDFSSSSSARVVNVKNGTAKLDGKVLYPGESFSVLENMLPFSEENGYEPAASYANGEVVETFGGGICQVSTTLYIAVLRAELEVTERHNHSMIVSYVKPSMDAAIAEESGKDFQFVNNLEAPVYIEGYTYGGMIYFTVYGEEYRSDDHSVTYESETISTTSCDTELKADTEKAFGSIETTQYGHTGYEARLWKNTTENGETTREQVNSSVYQMTPNKYSIGVQTSNSAAADAMYAAIATNDLSEVYKVIYAYGG